MVHWGALVSDRYNQLSLLRTIELVFGLDPLTPADRQRLEALRPGAAVAAGRSSRASPLSWAGRSALR